MCFQCLHLRKEVQTLHEIPPHRACLLECILDWSFVLIKSVYSLGLGRGALSPPCLFVPMESSADDKSLEFREGLDSAVNTTGSVVWFWDFNLWLRAGLAFYSEESILRAVWRPRKIGSQTHLPSSLPRCWKTSKATTNWQGQLTSRWKNLLLYFISD